MGFFDIKWIIEIEYSDGFLRSNKIDTIIVDAKNDYEAKQKVKNDPQYQHKYLWIKSVKRYDSKSSVEQEIDTTEYSSSSHTRSEDEIRQEKLEREKEWKEYQHKLEIESKEKQIRKIQRSPIVTLVVGSIITLVAFLLGWIPYWYWDIRLTSDRNSLSQLLEWGHSMQETYLQELYMDGLYSKDMRNSCIWIPFVILAVGITVTTILAILKNKSKSKRLEVAQKELEELKK